MAEQQQLTDVFKFVAVRPPQLVPHRPIGLISDPRSSTEPPGNSGDDGMDAPLDDDLRMAPLAEAGRRLADYFAGQPAGAEVVVPSEFSDELSELADAGDATELSGKAWDAVYAAYRSGPTAGPVLETPLGVLRLLHFDRLMRDGRLSTAADAETALTATAVVPAALAQSPGSLPEPALVTPPPEEPNEHLRQLVEEVAATRMLLNRIGSINLKAKPAVETEKEATGEGDVRRQLLRVSRMASIAPVLSDTAPRELRSIAARLNIIESTSIPAASISAQQHMSVLLHRADRMRHDPTLQRTVHQLSGSLDLSDLAGIVPEIDLIWRPTPVPALGSSPDVDVSGKIRPLGIGDLKVVKQTLLAYQPGEVAHIENVLAGEHKERIHRTLDRTETTYFESIEENTETQRDNQSTERFELKKEADKTIKEDMSVQAGVTVTAAFGPVVTTAHGDFAYSTSKQESQRSSSNFAREVVDRSVSKIQKKVRAERTTKTFHETEETNKHGINNEGQDHTIGVYRWVDKKYRAQVYNYGRRLMLEFIVPQPAAFWLATQKRKKPRIDAKPPEPFELAPGKRLTAKDINETNYLIFASRWNAAGITPPPPRWVYASTSFEQSGVENGKTISKALKDLVVPDGYTLIYYIGRVSLVYVVGGPRFTITIGEDSIPLHTSTAAKHGSDSLVGFAPHADAWDNPQGPVGVTIVGYDINAYSVVIGANCERSERHYQDWQMKAFEKMSAAYEAAKAAYDQKVAQAEAQDMGIQIQGRNPAINREIETRELKKLCITMMTGSHLSDYNAMTDPPNQPDTHPEVDVLEALSEGPLIQFFEQAFDWPQMTYLFYPYFWGRKKNWVEVMKESDVDPLFTQFVQAGAARVVIPVSPAYNQAVAYFLAKKSPNLADRVWLGGDPPTIDDPLYKSIADEARALTDDLAGAKPEGKPWEFTVPTTLVWLQPGPDLPTFQP